MHSIDWWEMFDSDSDAFSSSLLTDSSSGVFDNTTVVHIVSVDSADGPVPKCSRRNRFPRHTNLPKIQYAFPLSYSIEERLTWIRPIKFEICFIVVGKLIRAHVIQIQRDTSLLQWTMASLDIGTIQSIISLPRRCAHSQWVNSIYIERWHSLRCELLRRRVCAVMHAVFQPEWNIGPINSSKWHTWDAIGSKGAENTRAVRVNWLVACDNSANSDACSETLCGLMINRVGVFIIRDSRNAAYIFSCFV